MGRVYVARLSSVSVSVVKTLIQVTAPSTAHLKILRAWISNDASETSQQEVAQILRKTAGGTGTSFTPIKLDPNDAVAGATVINNLTAEGTDGDILISEGFNILNGWLYVPVPEERIIVPPGGIIGLKLATLAAAFTVSAGLVWMEE